MAKSRRNQFGGHNEQAQKDAQKAAADLIGGDTTPRVKLKDGRNVVWMLPRFGGMAEPIQRMLIHYGPFHVCGRHAKTPDPTNPRKMLEDRNFKNCYRCLAAWNAYDAAGKPGAKDKENQPPEKKKFKRDMPNNQVAIQVVNLTPFFEKGLGDLVVNKTNLPQLKSFKKIALGGEPAASISEDVVDAALAGTDVLLVSEDLSTEILMMKSKQWRTYDLSLQTGLRCFYILKWYRIGEHYFAYFYLLAAFAGTKSISMNSKK